MVFVGLFFQVFILFVFSYVLDYFNKRGEIVLVGFFCYLVGYIFNCVFMDLSDSLKGVKYFGVVWIQMFGIFFYFFNIVWLLFVCDDFEQRVFVMVG